MYLRYSHSMPVSKAMISLYKNLKQDSNILAFRKANQSNYLKVALALTHSFNFIILFTRIAR